MLPRFSWFAFLLATWLSAAAGSDPTPPKFTGDSLPTPPQQKAAWNPTRISPVADKWIDAARSLFDQGLADPRGCDYREIEVVAGDISGGAGVIKAHGWVLPRDPAWKQDFAVCWNGLVYPMVSTGAPADFRADALAHEKPEPTARFMEGSEECGLLGVADRIKNIRKLSVKACLLLRLDEEELACREAGLDPREDPYLEWACGWAWSLWDRAVCAHMRADDRLALASLRQLDGVNAALEKEAGRRGFKPDLVSNRFSWLRISFAELLADQEHRAKLPKRQMVIEARRDKYPDKPARITALIQDIQQVSVRQFAQPGGLGPYTWDPTVQALIAEGEEAVPPLLEAWETDRNWLTRSISFSRNFFPDRRVHSVTEPIQAALAAIMQVSLEDFRTLPSGSTPSSVRDYWEKMRGVPVAERWYRTLADDSAGVEAWLRAAQEIVRPMVLAGPGNGGIAGPAPMAGESLRPKSLPALTELFAKRLRQLTPPEAEIDRDFSKLECACAFGVAFLNWDREAGARETKPVMELAMRHGWDDLHYSSAKQILAKDLADFAIACMETSDASGLDDYCVWLAKGTAFRKDDARHFLNRQNIHLVEPLWRYPRSPGVLAAVSALFGGTKTAPAILAPLLESRTMFENLTLALARTPMLRFPEVRANLLLALADSTQAGTMTLATDGARTTENAMWHGEPPLPGAQVGVPVTYRFSDALAHQLSQWKGMPPIDLAWPRKNCDAAIVECVRRLRAPGNIFELAPPPKLPFE